VTTRVDVKGAARLASTLDGAARQLGDLRAAAGEAGRIVTSAAAHMAPRRTGRLASSLAPEVDGSAVVVGTDVVYGPPIHNGWVRHNIEPNPFLADALDRTSADWVGAYVAGVDDALASVEGV
jgi:hypothetical protein